ncbi:MAG TPA: hypothetical protein DCZ92_13335 [Elusimicrobia bacterium]|nr:MAG: hypothetical protein A2016_02095 [Elusimicrobia bacterium GWF2_62_30]HBA61765.1 hypothetical protein [Elusimicrobiota bacterium]
MKEMFADKKNLRAALALGVAAATFVVFAPAIKNGFVNWDDLGALLDNRHYRGFGWQNLKWMFTTFHMGLYQPLSWLTYALDHALWGMNPHGYHLTNILLHAAGASVFFLLCAELLRAARPEKEAGRGLLFSAAFAALFFSLHPLRVESVAWVTERRDVLSGLFYLLSIYWYVRARAAAAGQTRPASLGLSLAAFVLALLSKGITVTLPAALLLLDLYPLRRLPPQPKLWFSPQARPVWREKLPYLVLGALFAAAGYAAQGSALRSFGEFGLGDRALHSLYSTMLYAAKTALPLNLSPLYQLSGGALPVYLFGGLSFIIVTAALFFLRGRWPAGAAAWAFYLVTLAPVMGIVKFGAQAAADRYTYLSCLSFALLAGAGFLAAWRAAEGKYRGLSSAAACAVLLALAWSTNAQIKVWRDSETLWNRVLALDPGIDLAHNNLGTELLALGRAQEAFGHFEEALRLNPAYPGAHYNLGKYYEEKGLNPEAAEHYAEALRLDPRFARAGYNLGLLFEKQGKTGPALFYYEQAIKGDPGFAGAHYNAGTLLAALGELARAAGHFTEAVRIDPQYADAHTNLCAMLAAQGRLEDGIAHCSIALKLDPRNTKAHYNMALALASGGNRDEAARHYLAALELNPQFAEAHFNLAQLLAASGDKAGAAAHYALAIRLNPRLAPAPNR